MYARNPQDPYWVITASFLGGRRSHNRFTHRTSFDLFLAGKLIKQKTGILDALLPCLIESAVEIEIAVLLS